jgi:hypothetical protein
VFVTFLPVHPSLTFDSKAIVEQREHCDPEVTTTITDCFNLHLRFKGVRLFANLRTFRPRL